MIDLDTLAGCKKCRAIFDVSEMSWIRVPVPKEEGDVFAYDEQCPRCGERSEGNITYDIYGCYSCGEPYIKGPDCIGLCHACEQKAVEDPEMLFKYAEQKQMAVSINQLVGTLFSRAEINGILFRELCRRLHKEGYQQSEVKNHLAGWVKEESMDIADFMRYIKEEKKNESNDR